MPYTVTQTALLEVLILEPKVFGGDRGFFFDRFNQCNLQLVIGLDVNFVQDNYNNSSRGGLRCLHYQIQHPQGKLVWVTYGLAFDVDVNLHRSSPNFGKSVGVDCLQTISASCGVRQVLLMALSSPVNQRSFSTKRPTNGTPSMTAACCGVILILALIGRWLNYTAVGRC